MQGTTVIGAGAAGVSPVSAVALDGRLPEDAARLAKLAALALALTPLLDAERALDVAAEHLGALLPGARGYLLVWECETQHLVYQAPFGLLPPARLPPDLVPDSRSLCGRAIVDGAPYVARSAAAAHDQLAPWEWPLAEAALIAAPLAAGPELRAALLLAAQAPAEDDLRLIGAVCAAVGGTLARARAHRTAQHERLAGMGRLTAAIAHEVNNPLQAISNSLHLLLNRSLSDDKRDRYLSMAQKEVELLIDVVRRMLDFSRPARDGMRPISVHAALESVLLATAEQLHTRGIAVERAWDERLPRVSGVASHLKQAFLNLVLAAVAAMPEGGRLAVRTSVAPREGGGVELVVIEIADSGARLPEDELRTLFEPFQQHRRDTSGMGLAVSYSIIAQHGGRLSVTSSDDGTTFRVELPALGARG
ncbi:MAG TPA: ATP-binding protein [Roseiflexaceae bacterium]|nr:ATP-binding protein [Roseiflexaceae bacterium]